MFVQRNTHSGEKQSQAEVSQWKARGARKRRLAFALVACALIICGMLLANTWLSLDDTQRCDAVLVLAGETQLRISAGIDLVQRQYGHHLIVDVPQGREYGVKSTELARNFLQTQLTPDQFTICEFSADSTLIEARHATECLKQFPNVHSVLLVTHDFHTRRALMCFRQAAPDLSFHVSGVRDPYIYRPHWWHTRENTKYFVESMAKMVWYVFVERWLAYLHLM
ncbi:MAG: hypothetical protein NVS9B15_00620 [Acidobacteriaceae bacterium]